jgi:magnesium chelatase accessory protein
VTADSIAKADQATSATGNTCKITHRQIPTNGLSWHVTETGSGPVCLLLHGTGASSHSWHALTPFLSDRYKVIAVDLPGHAETLTPKSADLSLPAMAKALNELLILENIQPHMIIGHSAGAAIMAELCLSHDCPAAHLVSINGALLPLQGIAGWVFSPMAKLSAAAGWLPKLFASRANDPRQVRRLLESTGSVIDASTLGVYQSLFQNPQHVAGVLRMMAHWKLEPLLPRLSKLMTPIQLIAATGDRTIPLRDAYRLNTLMTQSTLHIIENKGHLVHEEAADQVAKLITSACES